MVSNTANLSLRQLFAVVKIWYLKDFFWSRRSFLRQRGDGGGFIQVVNFNRPSASYSCSDIELWGVWSHHRSRDHWTRLPMLWPRREDPKLIIRVINFEPVQSICSRYINVTDRRNRRTDVRLITIVSRTSVRGITIVIPRIALRASRGKLFVFNEKKNNKSFIPAYQLAHVRPIKIGTGILGKKLILYSVKLLSNIYAKLFLLSIAKVSEQWTQRITTPWYFSIKADIINYRCKKRRRKANAVTPWLNNYHQPRCDQLHLWMRRNTE